VLNQSVTLNNYHNRRSDNSDFFADDLSLYYQISCYDNCLKLQIDLTHVYKWSLKLSPRRCEVVNISNKRSPIAFEYTIGSHKVSWSKKVKPVSWPVHILQTQIQTIKVFVDNLILYPISS